MREPITTLRLAFLQRFCPPKHIPSALFLLFILPTAPPPYPLLTRHYRHRLSPNHTHQTGSSSSSPPPPSSCQLLITPRNRLESLISHMPHIIPPLCHPLPLHLQVYLQHCRDQIPRRLLLCRISDSRLVSFVLQSRLYTCLPCCVPPKDRLATLPSARTRGPLLLSLHHSALGTASTAPMLHS